VNYELLQRFCLSNYIKEKEIFRFEISNFFPLFSFIFRLSPCIYYVFLLRPSSLNTSHLLSISFCFFTFFPSVSLRICLLVLRWLSNLFSHNRHFSLSLSFCVFRLFFCPIVFLPPFETFLLSLLVLFTPPFFLRSLLVST